jgi:hypothetical protein
MNIEDKGSTAPSRSILATLGTGLLLVSLLTLSCVGIHAGMEFVYDKLEDKCVLSVCLNRVPNHKYMG